MKKFLSMFVALAMVLSLFAGAMAPTAKAAYGDIALSTPVLNNVAYWSGGKLVFSNVRGLTMGDVITGRVDGVADLDPNPAVNNYGWICLTDTAGNVIAHSPVDALGNFALQSTSAIKDGQYHVSYLGVLAEPVNGTWVGPLYTAGPPTVVAVTPQSITVYIKYIFVETSPSVLAFTCQSATFSGWVKTGGGSTSLPVGLVNVYMPDTTLGTSSGIGTDGGFAQSLVINQKGTYNVVVADAYDNAFGNFIYYSVSTGTASLTINTIIDPTLLYNTGVLQNFAVVVRDQDGDGVTGIPSIAWTVSGLVAGFTVTEVDPTNSAGVYIFRGIPSAIGAVSVALINYSYAGSTVSASAVIKVLAVTNFNPQIYFYLPDERGYLPYDLSWDQTHQTMVYAGIPCTVGSYLPLQGGLAQGTTPTGYANLPGYGSGNDITWEARGSFGGPVTRLIHGADYAYMSSTITISSKFFDEEYGYALNHMSKRDMVVEGPGTITFTVKAKIWEKVPGATTIEYTGDRFTGTSALPLYGNTTAPNPDNVRYNACCIEKIMVFTICTVATCKVDVTTGTKASSAPKSAEAETSKVFATLTAGDKTDINVAISQDPASGVNCGCNIVVHVISNPFRADQFTLANGVTKVGELWYNPSGITPAGYLSAPLTTDPYNTTSVGGVVTFKNITVNHSANDFQWTLVGGPAAMSNAIAVEAWGELLLSCPANTTIHPKIFFAPRGIEVLAKMVGMTTTILASKVANPTKMVAGVSEVLKISGFSPVGGVLLPALNAGYYTMGWTDGNSFVSAYTFADLGSGSYQATISPAFERDGTAYFDIYAADGDSYGEATVDVLMPVFDITITTSSDETIPNDHILTAGVAEKINYSATDPRDAKIMITPTSCFAMHTGMGTALVGAIDYTHGYADWPISACGLPTSYVMTTNTCGGCSPLSIIALDNPNVKEQAQVALFFVSDGANLIMDYFDVKNPELSVTPNKDIPFTDPATKTALTFSALDAHGKPLVRQYVTVWTKIAGGLDWADTDVGITGTDGKLTWLFNPNYQGAFYATLGLSAYWWGPMQLSVSDGPSFHWPTGWEEEYAVLTQKYFYTKYMAPVADITAPVIKVDAGIDGTTVGSDLLTLGGKVTDNVAVTLLYVGFNKVDILPDGSFSTGVKLVAGENAIKIVAYDAAGNKGEVTVKVTFNAAASKTITLVLTIGIDVVSINGKATSIDAAPEIINSRTFVPIRFIAESFGAAVEWLPETQGITITLGDHTIGLQIGNATAVIDGTIVSLSAAPYIKNGRTMVPLRVISEAFGGDVVWDPAARTITITYAP
jgi:hypothetical protein